jgi:hypothetical protein
MAGTFGETFNPQSIVLKHTYGGHAPSMQDSSIGELQPGDSARNSESTHCKGNRGV